MWKDRPLKKVGFHINKGAIPHLVNMQIIKISQEVPPNKRLLVWVLFEIYKNIISRIYQSNVKKFKYKTMSNKNKFIDDINDTQ